MRGLIYIVIIIYLFICDSTGQLSDIMMQTGIRHMSSSAEHLTFLRLKAFVYVQLLAVNNMHQLVSPVHRE